MLKYLSDQEIEELMQFFKEDWLLWTRRGIHSVAATTYQKYALYAEETKRRESKAKRRQFWARIFNY